MPIIKSAIKRSRQQIKRRRRNLTVKLAVKQDTKAVLAALASDPKSADAALRAAISELDRAVKKGVLHKNTAARRKSTIAKAVDHALSDSKPAKKPAAASTRVKSTTKKPAPGKAKS
jgi:small subunit ribosomal protein S20